MTGVSSAKIAAAAAFCFLLGCSTYVANAAEIKVLSSGALSLVLAELVPQFERSKGDKAAIEFASAAALKRRIDGGETADVAILTPVLIGELIEQGKIAPGTTADIARTGIGIAVRAGVPKPDVGSVELFKQALIDAKSIGYTDPALGGLSGNYVAGMLERLGMAAELKPKIKLTSNAPHALARALANGEIELGLIQTSEIATEPGVQFVGPLPQGLQNFSRFTGGVFSTSKQPQTGEAFIQFLVSPAALTVIKAKGMEPG